MKRNPLYHVLTDMYLVIALGVKHEAAEWEGRRNSVGWGRLPLQILAGIEAKPSFSKGRPEGLNYYLKTPRNSDLSTALKGRRMLLKDRFSPMCLPSSDLFLTPSQHPPFLSAIDKIIHLSRAPLFKFNFHPENPDFDIIVTAKKIWMFTKSVQIINCTFVSSSCEPFSRIKTKGQLISKWFFGVFDFF